MTKLISTRGFYYLVPVLVIVIAFMATMMINQQSKSTSKCAMTCPIGVVSYNGGGKTLHVLFRNVLDSYMEIGLMPTVNQHNVQNQHCVAKYADNHLFGLNSLGAILVKFDICPNVTMNINVLLDCRVWHDCNQQFQLEPPTYPFEIRLVVPRCE